MQGKEKGTKKPYQTAMCSKKVIRQVPGVGLVATWVEKEPSLQSQKKPVEEERTPTLQKERRHESRIRSLQEGKSAQTAPLCRDLSEGDHPPMRKGKAGGVSIIYRKRPWVASWRGTRFNYSPRDVRITWKKNKSSRRGCWCGERGRSEAFFPPSEYWQA